MGAERDRENEEEEAASGPTEGLLDTGSITPRGYQEAIVKEALDRNLLVVLPTGLGKTLISAMVAARLMEDHPDMRVLMMAPTRPLVMQHRDSFLRDLRLEEEDAVVMTGQVPPHRRQALWRAGRVFFTTPQIVMNDIGKGRLSLRYFSLLVFDEAHRAVKGYAYTGIARRYMEEGRYPLILGLTASPGGRRSRIEEVCANLSIERIVHRTHGDEDVRPFVHEIVTDWTWVDLPDSYRRISGLLGRMLDTRVRKLRPHGSLDRRFVGKKQILSLGQKIRAKLDGARGQERGPLFGALMLQSSCLSILHARELLESQGIRVVLRFLNRLKQGSGEKRSYRNLVVDPLFPQVMEMVNRAVGEHHPKMEALRLEVIRQISRPGSSKVLVFTQYRDTASLLVNALENDTFDVERFVGQSSRPGDEGLDQMQQRAVLDRFRRGETTVLVATSVAEEGLDIPDVDLVVFYEPIPSEIRFIQRRGRTGRRRIGRVVILAARDTVDTAFYYASRRKLGQMRGVLDEVDEGLEAIERGPRPEAGVPVSGRSATDGETGGPTDGPRGYRCPGGGRGHQTRLPLRKGPQGRPSRASGGRPRIPGEREQVRIWIDDLLDHGGTVYVADMLEEGLEQGHDRSTVMDVLGTMASDGLIFRPSRGSLKKVDTSSRDEDVHEVTITKVMRGEALLQMEDGRNVVLIAEEFPGRPSHIKRGRTLRVRGKTYISGDRTHIRVEEVLE